MTDFLRERISRAIGGQYRIDDEIGRGGMSVVYRAHDPRLNRDVAMKVLPPELAHDSAVRSRFTREAQTSAQLSHPNIVPIYDVGERDGVAYFVMGLVTGGHLAERLARHPLRPIDEVRRILAEVADALAYAHLRGVIHRDIKPDNILLESEHGRALVTDFGIARAMEEGARLTQTGIAVGTPTYMSPEQAVGERDIDGRSDVYSLGVVGYQMLTGRVPFIAGNSMALLLKHVSEPPRPILELRPETPKPLAEAIERALAKAPDGRWQTAAAFRDALVANTAAVAWRAEHKEPVRYASPIPKARRAPTPVPAPEPRAVFAANDLELEPPHLAVLTPEQRADLMLWRGRVNLLDRIRFARRFTLYTAGMGVLGVVGFVVGVEDVPPLVLAPIVPIVMAFNLWRMKKSLRAAGIKRVLFRLTAKGALGAGTATPSERKLEKLVTKPVLEGTHGALVRRAAADRAAILDLVAALPREDRALLPDVKPTVDALFDRVVALARTLHKMDGDLDASLLTDLNAQVAGMRASSDDERHTSLVRRQRESLEQLAERRATLTRQLEGAALALANLRLDLIKVRASGVGASIDDLSTATQEARALSHDISTALDAAASLRNL